MKEITTVRDELRRATMQLLKCHDNWRKKLNAVSKNHELVMRDFEPRANSNSRYHFYHLIRSAYASDMALVETLADFLDDAGNAGNSSKGAKADANSPSQAQWRPKDQERN